MDGLSTLAVGVAATAILLLCSAFFSSSETAIFSLPPEWVERQATTDDRRARVLKELHDDPHRLLVTLLVGNNIVNVAISSIVTVLVAESLPTGPAVVVTTVVTSVLLLIGGEIVPKSVGLANARTWSLTAAPVVRLVERTLAPVIGLFDWITRRISALVAAESAIERPYLD
ncbi:CNNM domain-containing protein [Candidatus Halobonum tyrrellensis]|uniref:CNNM transmembrane domain-containing protein n=1 Tax=Candidatus Halobonum tyrrellensis G22 TaxID=1324957 RepID=V4HCA3_9EURY|nr:DUF21 domain-containing protein [Candidatus Halobonum tyrrellensis]ESP87693.1 hypothetical protein K933_12770 [Candidatus Halobonum tyrrellensis G22]